MRVLVVDDNRDMLESVQLLLAHAGHDADRDPAAPRVIRGQSTISVRAIAVGNRAEIVL